MNPSPATIRLSRFGLVLVAMGLPVLVLTAPGCRTVEATAEIPGNVVRTVTGTKPPKPPPDPVVLQQEIFRFADEFTAFAGSEFRRLKGKWPEVPEERALESELNLNYRFLEIAGGPNAFANLVDLVFAVVLVRHQIEVYAVPEDPEGHLGPTLEVLKEYQRQALALATSTLGEEQQKLLRENVAAWLKSNVTQASGLHARYTGSISELLGMGKAQHQGAITNLFGSLMLDPFAGLDPTVREITQARLFAERAMYVAQRMPKLLQFEMELLKRRFFATPDVARLMANVDSVSRTVERIGVTVETLPDRLREEREGLTELVRETGSTFDAGSKAMEHLNTVVLSTDVFLGHLGVGDASNEPGAKAAPAADSAGTAPQVAPVDAAPPAQPSPSPPPGEPFRIQDYTAAAAQLAETAERVNTLVVTLDRTLATATSDEVAAKIDVASQAAVARGRDVVDHAFRRALLFVALSCVMIFGSVLAYKFVVRRMRT